MGAAAVLHRVAIPLHEPFRISSGTVAVKESILVELSLDGVTGFGEASPMPGSFYSSETPDSSWRELEQRLVPYWLAHPSAHPEELAARLEEVSPDPFARAGLEGACWDLLARRSAKPLLELLGSSKRPIPSGVAVGLYDTLEELLDRVGRFLVQGYRRVKIKIQPGWDIEPVRAIRERFGSIPLMVDANASYTLADAPVFEEMDRFGLMMYEQPLAKDAFEEAAELQRRVHTPICADESADSPAALERILRLGAAKILNIKVQRVGGLAIARRMYDLAVRAGMSCWLGTMPELGVASAQALHLATLDGFTFPTDVEASLRWFADDLVNPLLEVDREGYLHIPEGPASGWTLDRAKLERYQVASLRLQP